jgi:hypothetical protein
MRAHSQPHRELVDTLRMFACPKGSDWNARKDAAEDGPECVANDNSHDSIIANLEGFDRKDASVLNKHRPLRQPQR